VFRGFFIPKNVSVSQNEIAVTEKYGIPLNFSCEYKDAAIRLDGDSDEIYNNMLARNSSTLTLNAAIATDYMLWLSFEVKNETSGDYRSDTKRLIGNWVNNFSELYIDGQKAFYEIYIQRRYGEKEDYARGVVIFMNLDPSSPWSGDSVFTVSGGDWVFMSAESTPDYPVQCARWSFDFTPGKQNSSQDKALYRKFSIGRGEYAIDDVLIGPLSVIITSPSDAISPNSQADIRHRSDLENAGGVTLIFNDGSELELRRIRTFFGFYEGRGGGGLKWLLYYPSYTPFEPSDVTGMSFGGNDIDFGF
jgi:hypothetical protein